MLLHNTHIAVLSSDSRHEYLETRHPEHPLILQFVKNHSPQIGVIEVADQIYDAQYIAEQRNPSLPEDILHDTSAKPRYVKITQFTLSTRQEGMPRESTPAYREAWLLWRLEYTAINALASAYHNVVNELLERGYSRESLESIRLWTPEEVADREARVNAEIEREAGGEW